MSFAPPEPASRAALQPPVPGASSSAPPPPPPPQPGYRALHPGDVTPPWRIALAVAWVLAFFAYAAVWQASVQIGIATWWVGPRAQPTAAIVRFIPFLLCIVMAMLMIYGVRRIALVSAIGSFVAAAIAIPDFDRTTSLGIVELAVAGLVLLVSISALSGRYRVAR